MRYGTEDDRKSHEIPEAGFWRFSFDTTGGTHKVTQSLDVSGRLKGFFRTFGDRPWGSKCIESMSNSMRQTIDGVAVCRGAPEL